MPASRTHRSSDLFSIYKRSPIFPRATRIDPKGRPLTSNRLQSIARQHDGREVVSISNLLRGGRIFWVMVSDRDPLQGVLQIARLEASDLLILPLLISFW